MKELPTGHLGFTAVPTWLLGQASPIELAVLLAIQEAPDQQISLTDLGSKAGVCRRTASNALAKMAARGWLAKEVTTEEDGAIGPNRYVLRIWGDLAEAPEQPPSPPQPQRRERSERENGAVPIALMAACSVKKGALFVYLALQLFEAPTISTLATVCCMAPEDVRVALKFLEEGGWIQRIDRPGSSSLFRVFFERVGARRG
jgi:DNA-binding MarR family transcriptional regulator